MSAGRVCTGDLRHALRPGMHSEHWCRICGLCWACCTCFPDYADAKWTDMAVADSYLTTNGERTQ